MTTISLIYANVNPDDILLKEELDTLAAQHPKRFSVYYVLNNPPEGWTGGVGFVTADMIKEHCPPPSNTLGDMKILMCGEYRVSPSYGKGTGTLTTCSPYVWDCVLRLVSTGPPPMMTAMKKHLDTLGYEKPRTVSKKDDQVFMF